MADFPWKGAARPMSPGAFEGAADTIGCEVAAIRAVWDVEAAGRGFLRDGTLIHRFEPHHMPDSPLTWRDSLKIGPSRREALFREAWARSREAALRAASWGAPQVMGFNAEDAGHRDALDMVEAMADGEDAHLQAFVSLVQSWGLDSALRSHDWHEFARRYNGSGQPGVYARKIERAYRRHSGKKSPTVLRLGARGAAVKRLQRALGVKVDGAFGRETEKALRAFQEAQGLAVDGVAGQKTWAALADKRDAKPKAQPTKVDQLADKALDLAVKGGSGFGAGRVGEAVLDRTPDGAITVLTYGLVALGLFIAAVLAVKWARDA